MTMPSIYADAKTLEEWKHLFDQAKKIGLKFMVGEPDPQFLDDINRMAGQYQMKFAIHEHAKGLSKYWHPDSAMAAIKDRENLKICADIGHWVRSGLDPLECLKKVEGNVISVHVKDLDSFGNLNATDVNISTGIIDYPKVFEELKRQQFDGYVFIECEHDWEDNLKDVKESVNYITQVSK
jgi:sugar phosphate isomerase/epimerase